MPTQYIESVKINQASHTAVTVNVTAAGGSGSDAQSRVRIVVLDGGTQVATGSVGSQAVSAVLCAVCVLTDCL